MEKPLKKEIGHYNEQVYLVFFPIQRTNVCQTPNKYRK